MIHEMEVALERGSVPEYTNWKAIDDEGKGRARPAVSEGNFKRIQIKGNRITEKP